MDIKLQNLNDVSAKLTVTLAPADYEEKVNQSLKNFRKKANFPGFRPGMVPMSLVKKQYGTAIKVDEINKLLQEAIYNYIKDNKVDVLGEPLPNEEQQKKVNIEEDEEMSFEFDLAIAPQFDATLSAEDVVPYYTIKVTDEMVDNQIGSYTQRNGRYDSVDEYQDGDMVKGIISELDEAGNTKEGGIRHENATMLPQYMRNDESKALFNGTKKDDIITINPRKAYDGNETELTTLLGISKEEAKNVSGDFSFQITDITRFVPGELNQQLFDQVYGEGVVKSEEEFKAKVKADIAAQLAPESDYRFLLDFRKHMMDRIGKLPFADDLLKKILLSNREDKDVAKMEEEYPKTVEELQWHLIYERLIRDANIKVENSDIEAQAKEAVRAQFAQYGMTNVPDELLANYSKEMLTKKDSVQNLADRAIETKLIAALKKAVKLKKKSVSTEDFNKLFEEK
ncbi:MAG: trigger factor [Bacteroidaceae bacterium]|nr:trigger factor [Bacteroidaceae bacterium]MBO4589613.1 trigger factor [Bacteroidaceae bacterium]